MVNITCPNCYESDFEELDPENSTVHIGTIVQCEECKARYRVEDYEIKYKKLDRWDDEEVTTVIVDF